MTATKRTTKTATARSRRAAPPAPGAPPWRALAAAAHPDDIEFMMAGTLLQLQAAGAEIHLWNLANGSCGTETLDRLEIIRRRWAEAQQAARLAGARIHPPLADDFHLTYEPELLAKAAAILRRIRPDVLLIPSPQDYMEDHQNAGRLLVAAAFTRGMKNFVTTPPVPPYARAIAVYHALPYGLRDGLRRLVRAEIYVDVAPVQARKREMLAAHASQREWLARSQGVDAYLASMAEMDRRVGEMSGRFVVAEGWRRHNHLGFGPADYDPLTSLLGNAAWVDPAYEQSLG